MAKLRTDGRDEGNLVFHTFCTRLKEFSAFIKVMHYKTEIKCSRDAHELFSGPLQKDLTVVVGESGISIILRRF